MAYINKTPAFGVFIKTGDTLVIPVEFKDANGHDAPKTGSTAVCSYWTTKDMSGAATGTFSVDVTDIDNGKLPFTIPGTLVAGLYYCNYVLDGDWTVFEFSLDSNENYAVNPAVDFTTGDKSIKIYSKDEKIIVNHTGALVTGGGGGGVTDHGALTGLGDDDHAQYANAARFNAWLGTSDTADLPEGTNLYYTEARVSANTDVAANTAKVGVGTNTVTTANLAQIAQDEVLMRETAGTGNVEAVTVLDLVERVFVNATPDDAPNRINDTVAVKDANGGITQVTLNAITANIPENNVTTTTYTVLSSDIGKDLHYSNASQGVFTIDTYANQPMRIGAIFLVTWVGVGQPTVVAGAGVTLNVESGFLSNVREQYASIIFRQIDTDIWYAQGALEVA